MQCAVYVMDIDRYASDIDSWQLSQHKTKRTERTVGNKYFPNNMGGREENKMCKLASRLVSNVNKHMAVSPQTFLELLS